MKYFRAVNKDDVTDVLYVSGNRDADTIEQVMERLQLAEYGYKLVECTQEEFDTMTQDQNDYILNVGQDRYNLDPFASAHTEFEAIEKAKELRKTWKCVEVVYMPQDNIDINDIIWSDYDCD
jgi:hypothetical protein